MTAMILSLTGLLMGTWNGPTTTPVPLGIVPRAAATARDAVRPGRSPADDGPSGRKTVPLLADAAEDPDDGFGPGKLPSGPPGLLRPVPPSWSMTDLRPGSPALASSPARFVATCHFRC